MTALPRAELGPWDVQCLRCGAVTSALFDGLSRGGEWLYIQILFYRSFWLCPLCYRPTGEQLKLDLEEP
jgi:hypothetical protein